MHVLIIDSVVEENWSESIRCGTSNRILCATSDGDGTFKKNVPGEGIWFASSDGDRTVTDFYLRHTRTNFDSSCRIDIIHTAEDRNMSPVDMSATVISDVRFERYPLWTISWELSSSSSIPTSNDTFVSEKIVPSSFIKRIATRVNNRTPNQRYPCRDYRFRHRMMPKTVRRVGAKASG